MMRPSLSLMIFLVGAARADIAITVDGDGSHHLTSTSYEVVLAPDGRLDRLRVHGTDFVDPTTGMKHAGYFYAKGPLTNPTIERVDDRTLRAIGPESALTIVGDEDRMVWTFSNRTAARLIYVMIVDPAVQAVALDRGPLMRLPVEMAGRTSVWYRDRAKLTIDGGTRIWGPWAGKYCIWEVGVEPEASREVTFTSAEAPEEESARAAEVARTEPQPPAEPDGPMWDLAALSAPPRTWPADGFAAEGVRALFYEGVPFQGRPTKVFAWLGLPAVRTGEKVPGIVLIHGGGGTAFDSWVRLWTWRGYAAISMDTCGCVPGGEHGQRPRHEDGGPPGWGGYGQIDWPRTDQWCYHAVAAAILGHSLLRSLPEVDADRIGVTGISWGGYLCCIVAGVDHRFRFAVPVYGCGFTLDHAFAGSVRGLGEERAARWMRWWDPSAYLPAAAMPMLWVTGTNDFAYWLPALQKSYRLPSGPRTLAVRLRMPHGHGPAGEGPEEIRAFADGVVNGGPGLARITDQGRDGRRIWATFTPAVPVAAAELLFTRDTTTWPERLWEVAPAQLGPPGRVEATLPDGVTCYFLNLVDERGLVVSTEHEELAP